MRAAAATLLLAACLLAPVQAQRRRTLKDDNFEHITQAATGQTTGIWFVNFCSPKARACKEELAGAWEELAKELLQGQEAFLTTVDVHSNPKLRQRFHIQTLPTLLLFRDRKMYRFGGKLTPGSAIQEQLRAFIREGYAGVEAEAVPPPASALDWLRQGVERKLAHIQEAVEKQDVRALVLALLPILGVCLLGIVLLLGATLRRTKTKRE